MLHLERPPCFDEYRKARDYSEVSKGEYNPLPGRTQYVIELLSELLIFLR